MINPYGPIGGSPIKLCLAHKIVLPKPQYWSLIEPIPGHINALDKVGGLAVATNGLLYAILTERLEILFGHSEWFVPTHSGPSGHPRNSASEESNETPDISEYV